MINWEFSPHLDKNCTFRRKLQYLHCLKVKTTIVCSTGLHLSELRNIKYFTLLKAITFQQRKKQLLMYRYAGTTEYHKKIRDKIMSFNNEIWGKNTYL